MEAIANVVLAAMDLAEAEGRAVHRGIIRLLIRMAAVVCAAVLGLAGVWMVLRGIYQALTVAVGPIWASLISGGILLALAVAAYLYGRLAPKPAKSKVPAEVNTSTKSTENREGMENETFQRTAA